MTRLLIVAALAGCVAPVDETASVEQHTDETLKSLKDGADWLGAYYNYAQAFSFVLSLFGDDAEHELHDDLVRLYTTMTELEAEVSALGGEILSADMENDVSDVGTASIAARRDLATYGTVPPDRASLYLNNSMERTQRLQNNGEYWHRLFVDAATYGEWRTITAFRPPVDGGRVWDYRFALPALIAAVPMRISTLLAADPTHLKAGTYATELGGYRSKLAEAMTTIENNLSCGYQIAADFTWDMYGRPAVSYHVHVICGDPFTGTELTATRDYLITSPYSMLTPHFGAAFSVFDTDGTYLWYADFPTQVSLWRDWFWNHVLPGDPFLGTWMDDTLQLLHAQLRTKLGLFQLRRAIDNLSTVIDHDPGPVALGRVHSDLANLCLSSQLSLSGGANQVVTATCDAPFSGHTFGQVWTYDPLTARLRNSDVGGCLAIQGDPYRPMQWLVTVECNPIDEHQQWSYDPDSHRLRNAQGFVADIYNGTTTPGAQVWTYWDTGSVAQQWGFNYTIIGGGGTGPHL